MTVCLFLRWFVSLSKFGVLQPSQGPVDNIVVRPSRVRGEREKKKEDRIDERMQGQQVPVILKTQNNKTPRHCELPNTIVRPNQQIVGQSFLRP